MPNQERVIKNCSFQWSVDDVLANYSEIPHAKVLAVPEEETEWVESTSVNSTGGYKTYIPGLRDTSEISVPVGHTRLIYNQAVVYRKADQLIWFKTFFPLEEGLLTPDGVKFTAYVNPKITSDGVGENFKFDMMLRVTGEPTPIEGDLIV